MIRCPSCGEGFSLDDIRRAVRERWPHHPWKRIDSLINGRRAAKGRRPRIDEPAYKHYLRLWFEEFDGCSTLGRECDLDRSQVAGTPEWEV